MPVQAPTMGMPSLFFEGGGDRGSTCTVLYLILISLLVVSVSEPHTRVLN